MAMRAVILTSDASEGNGALIGALTQVHALTEVRTNAAQPGRRAWWLASYRPDLVIAAAEAPDALLAALYRMVSPRTRLLVRLHSPSWRDGVLGALRRAIVLNQADAVLAEDATAGAALPPRWTRTRARRERVFPLRGPADLDAFLACPVARPPCGPRRIAFAGPLSPRSGAIDVLLCVAAWVGQHGGDPVEIWWIGEGDLVGVLDAQPLPPGMGQRFLGPQDRAGLAECFAQCGLLVLPMEAEADGAAADRHPVAEAVAAGLVVVGSQRNAQVCRHVVDGVTGWTFDPRRPGQLGQAIGRALGAAAEDLAAMGAKARERIRHLAAETDAERLHAALSAVLPSPAAAPAAPRPGLAAVQQPDPR